MRSRAPRPARYGRTSRSTTTARRSPRWPSRCGVGTKTKKSASQRRAVAALEEQSDWEEEKFLLVQGDFAGIQDFIFAEGGQTQSQAARLLRGRSFQVALLTELAALATLEALNLPSTSQIINAAGKFLIVAPNRPETDVALTEVRRRLDAWCLEQGFGEISLNLAAQPASCADFTRERFPALMRRLFEALEAAKLRRFDLCGPEAARADPFGLASRKDRAPMTGAALPSRRSMTDPPAPSLPTRSPSANIWPIRNSIAC
jgi:CRISPR-associated protein Cas10/Csm1 subtype III-A